MKLAAAGAAHTRRVPRLAPASGILPRGPFACPRAQVFKRVPPSMALHVLGCAEHVSCVSGRPMSPDWKVPPAPSQIAKPSFTRLFLSAATPRDSSSIEPGTLIQVLPKARKLCQDGLPGPLDFAAFIRPGETAHLHCHTAGSARFVTYLSGAGCA